MVISSGRIPSLCICLNNRIASVDIFNRAYPPIIALQVTQSDFGISSNTLRAESIPSPSQQYI
ncbi:hypothetical protein LINPERHAP1_LOCUS32191 [Linum perenne]